MVREQMDVSPALGHVKPRYQGSLRGAESNNPHVFVTTLPGVCILRFEKGQVERVAMR